MVRGSLGEGERETEREGGERNGPGDRIGDKREGGKKGEREKGEREGGRERGEKWPR